MKIDYVAKAQASWGTALPDWVKVLAAEANRTNAKTTAKRIGYSAAVLSYVFSNSYQNGDIARVEAKVRGAMMGETVMCPVVGEIGRDRCLNEQKMGNTGASSLRSLFYRKCRGIGTEKCPHSRIGTEAGHG